MDKVQIEKKANDILRSYGFRDGIDTYIDVVGLARYTGFEVGEINRLPFADDGFIIITKDNEDNLIGVNRDRSIEDKRFIVAYELAHYFLHYDTEISDEVVVRHRVHTKEKDLQERDADYFAVCIPKIGRCLVNLEAHCTCFLVFHFCCWHLLRVLP